MFRTANLMDASQLYDHFIHIILAKVDANRFS